MKGDIHSPLRETFNLNDVSGGSQEDATDAAVVPDAGPATPSCRQRRIARQAKAGSRRGNLAKLLKILVGSLWLMMLGKGCASFACRPFL